jgi:tRNA (guanine26-N2/guanine27-N2)-dimethyltransferase
MTSFPIKTIIEGKTPVIVPDVDDYKETSSFPPGEAPVFYNEIMELNRDFALAILRVYAKLHPSPKSFLYCEPMAGTGVRSVRVAFEINNVTVVINDRNPIAVELIKRNVKNLKLKKITKIHTEDANALMLNYASQGKFFKVIDIDPFGSPAAFIDATAQAIKRDGLIAVTSTDMATMCGVYPKACIRKYASKPIHSSIAHEISVRMLFGYLAIALARHEKATMPVFAHSTDHYIRIYALAKKGITKAKETLEKIGFIAHCPNCFTIGYTFGLINNLPNQCTECKTKWKLGGPYWLGPLYNDDYVNNLETELSQDDAPYNTLKKMLKIITLIKEEVKTTSTKAMIGFYDLHQIADKLDIPSPKVKTTMSELEKMGFIAARTHFKNNSIKTDASVDKIIEAMKIALEK